MRNFTYEGTETKEISFPLGGIGTGCIGLGGDGRLVDWEIFNRPAKGAFNGFSHFAVRAERKGKVLDARILNGDLQPHYIGPMGPASYLSYFGAGPARPTLAGMPHFKQCVFKGPFPVAQVEFADSAFPGKATITAFNPFIPLDDKNSSIPAAFFEISLENTSGETLDYTIAGTLQNPQPANNLNRALSLRNRAKGVFLTSDSLNEDSVKYGDMTLASDAKSLSVQEYWYRGKWFDNVEVYWKNFCAGGKLKSRRYPGESAGDCNHATVAAHLTLRPGATAKARFIISWSFPNCENYWSDGIKRRIAEDGVPPTWKNYYATLWHDSSESASYGLANWDKLFAETLKFRAALLSSTLPPEALDAISANLSILKSPTVLRLTDGSFYGWEGVHPVTGSCEGSCTHVWNYAMALPFLFPKLERSMRETDYKFNLREDGGMPFRLQLPLGSRRSSFRPCADGQLGGVVKTYRDWRICGDDEWLRRIWPKVKASLEFAWRKDNPDQWDPGRTGILHGRQHNTLDMELFGPNSWLSGIYLAALKAASLMAAHLGDETFSVECGRLYEKGKRWLEDNLFNGQYYFQRIDLNSKKLLKPFDADGQTVADYWSSEHKQIKYQIGSGCSIDQTLAQWLSDIAGLGEIFDPVRNKKALSSIFKNNFKDPISQIANPWRIFCLNDEAGTIICSWPDEATRPAIPLTYSTETMNGFEYAVAAQMIRNGLLREGMAIVKSVRRRYDGERRNPWNEFECGSNYARSMASYSLLNAFSGFGFDMVEKSLSFAPVSSGKGNRFQCFWSLACAWGTFSLAKRGRGIEVKLEVLFGQLPLRRLSFPFEGELGKWKAALAKKSLSCEALQRDGMLALEVKDISLCAGDILQIGFNK